MYDNTPQKSYNLDIRTRGPGERIGCEPICYVDSVQMLSSYSIFKNTLPLFYFNTNIFSLFVSGSLDLKGQFLHL